MESDKVVENGSSGDDGILDEDIPGDDDLLDDAELDYTEDILEEANLVTDDNQSLPQDPVSEVITIISRVTIYS